MGFKHPIKKCSIDGCEKPLNARTWCEKHYKRWQTSGDPLLLKQSDLKGKKCYRCTKPARKAFLCNSHYTKQWRILNPEKALKAKRHSTYRRHLRQRNAVGGHTHDEWLDTLARYDGLCVYCDEKAESKDHATPLSRGGDDRIGNILPSCLRCNKRKQSKTVEEFCVVDYEDGDSPFNVQTVYINTLGEYEARYNGKTYHA